MSDYKKLEVWRNSHGLALNVHSAIKKIRGSDYVKLRSQMLGAAMSIPTNLVEGVGQKSRKEFCRFIRISLNSANELDYHLLLARDFKVMVRADHEALENQTATVRKMLHDLLRSLGDSGNGRSKDSPRS